MLFVLYSLPALVLAWGVYELFNDDSETSGDSETGGEEPMPPPPGQEGEDILATLGDDTPLTGTDGDDRIRGNEEDQIALGGAGDDTLLGLAGEDALFGEDGADRIAGGSLSDYVDGGAGDDQLEGNRNDDVIVGGTGADTLTGGNGADLLVGGELLDRALTLEELVQLRGDPNAEIDELAGIGLGALEDGAADALSGGNGNDTLILGAGDSGSGGTGGDEFLILPGDGTAPAEITDYTEDDVIALLKATPDAPGVVEVSAEGTDALVTLDGVVQLRVIGADPATVTAAARDPLSIEDLDALSANAPDEVVSETLTGRDDIFVGPDGAIANRVDGRAGDDLIDGAGGADLLVGDDGNDILIGGDGDDEAQGGDGADLVQGNGGEDKLLGGSGADWLNGGEGDDEVVANSGDDIVVGGDGADDLRGNNDNDILIGGNLFASDLSTEQLITLRDGGTLEGLMPGALDDGAVDILDGGNGDDLLVGASGDQLTGGRGEDTFMVYGNAPTEAVLVNDYDAPNDALAVLYDSGADAPVITVTEGDTGVYTVLADGVPVAVVASAAEAVTVADVLLVERNADGTVPLMPDMPEGAPIQ